MTEQMQRRVVGHRLAVLRHAAEVTGNVAQTCRYFGISRATFSKWLRRYNRHHGGLDGQTPYERLRQKTQSPV